MARSTKKGPFVDAHLTTKIEVRCTLHNPEQRLPVTLTVSLRQRFVLR